MACCFVFWRSSTVKQSSVSQNKFINKLPMFVKQSNPDLR